MTLLEGLSKFLLNFYTQFKFSFLQWNKNFRISIKIFKVIQFSPPPVWDSLSISRKTIWLGIRTHPGFVILTTTQKYKTSLILLRDDNLKFYKRFFTLRKIQRPRLGKFFELWTLCVFYLQLVSKIRDCGLKIVLVEKIIFCVCLVFYFLWL